LAASGAFAAETKIKVDRVRGFLIYEDTGKLSKNLATQSDQIIANDKNGTSIQMLVDIVLSGPADQTFENAPMLHVIARGALDDAGTPPIIDRSYPINYVATGGELVRSLVVDHNCNGFDLEASITLGNKVISDLKKTFSITCGD
jgi:hypothetical protein